MGQGTEVRNFSFGAIELRNQYRLKKALAKGALNPAYYPTLLNGGTPIDLGTSTIAAGNPYDFTPNGMDWLVYSVSKESLKNAITSFSVDYENCLFLVLPAGVNYKPKDLAKYTIDLYGTSGTIVCKIVDVGLLDRVVVDCTDVKTMLDAMNEDESFGGYLRFNNLSDMGLFYDFKLSIEDISIYAPLSVVPGLSVNYLDNKGVQLLLRPTIDFSLFELQPQTLLIDYSSVVDYKTGDCGYLLEKIGG